ncbi:MAG: hypothetical protein ACP5OG_00335 [Candidatus Nanoarchaeia archaeon]
MKKAQSEVISTILIVFLSIVAFSIISAFTINYIRGVTNKSKCTDVMGKIEIVNDVDFSCYYDPQPLPSGASKGLRLQIKLKDVSDEISGFGIQLNSVDSKTYKVTRTSSDSGICMYDKDKPGECLKKDSADLTPSVPDANSGKTYFIKTDQKPKTVNVNFIMSDGNVCDVSDTMTEIVKCI